MDKGILGLCYAGSLLPSVVIINRPDRASDVVSNHYELGIKEVIECQ